MLALLILSGAVFGLGVALAIRAWSVPVPQLSDALDNLSGARNRADALSRALGGFAHLLPVDEGALLSRGEFVGRELVVGRELGEPLEDLSEP